MGSRGICGFPLESGVNSAMKTDPPGNGVWGEVHSVVCFGWRAVCRKSDVTSVEFRPNFPRNAGYACGCFCLTLWSMGTSHLIAGRVSPETKANFRALAEQQQMTESALLKQLVELTVRRVNQSEVGALRPPVRRLRAARLCIRLHPEDQLLLMERAAARQMPAATYVSVLVRAHLRDLAPLPKAELMALKRSVAELGAIGRNLNQLTRLAHQQAGLAGVGGEDLRMMLKVCEAMRDHTKGLIRANARTWRVGHDGVRD